MDTGGGLRSKCCLVSKERVVRHCLMRETAAAFTIRTNQKSFRWLPPVIKSAWHAAYMISCPLSDITRTVEPFQYGFGVSECPYCSGIEDHGDLPEPYLRSTPISVSEVSCDLYGWPISSTYKEKKAVEAE